LLGFGVYGSLRGCVAAGDISWNERFIPSVEGCSVGFGAVGVLPSGYLAGHFDI
jgi:hypothetical protein